MVCKPLGPYTLTLGRRKSCRKALSPSGGVTAQSQYGMRKSFAAASYKALSVGSRNQEAIRVTRLNRICFNNVSQASVRQAKTRPLCSFQPWEPMTDLVQS